MLKKQYLKSRPVCKVTFSLPVNALGAAKEVRLIGDFNNWNWEEATIMKKGKTTFKTTVELPQQGRFQFRYVTDCGAWENDWAADDYTPSPYPGIDNSLCVLHPPVAEAIESPKANKKLPSGKKTTRIVVKKSTKTDDLTRIEGIGPKISGLLSKAGYDTFLQLSKASREDLTKVLEKAGKRYVMHDPTTWPKQAKLAAAGEMDKLDKLQAQLKGGRA